MQLELTLVQLKLLAIAGTFATGLSGLFIFPLKRLDKARLGKGISYINAFGSGIMIAVGLLHMLAEANKELMKSYDYPVAFLLAGVGFALVYMCEDVILVELVTSFSKEMVSSGIPVHTHGSAPHKEHQHWVQGQDHEHDPSHQGTCGTSQVVSAQHSGRTLYGPTTCSSKRNYPGGSEASEQDTLLFVAQDESSYGATIGSESEVHHGHDHHSHQDQDHHSHSHKHAHGHEHHIEVIQSISEMRTTFFAFSLLGIISVHAFFAGLSLGVERSTTQVWPTLIAIVAHKGAEAFVVGSAFLTSTLRTGLIVTLMLAFSSITPIGVAVGLTISELGDNMELTSGYLVSLAAGSFLYVGTLVLKEDDHVGECVMPRFHNLIRFIIWCFGFSLMAAAAIYT